ncbi:MAG: transposase [Actinomycetota bacterium]
MARQRRTQLTAPKLHVFTRGADRQDLFFDDADRVLFERYLGDAAGSFGLVIDAYALMTNHVHLLVDRSSGDVSGGMKHVLGRYAQHLNVRSDRTGPVFDNRFGCVEIESDEQQLQCSRYIHLNPLAFVPRPAIEAYRWSSLGVYAGRRASPDWLRTGQVARTHHTTDREYVEFVLRPQPGDDSVGRPPVAWPSLTLEILETVVADVAGVGADPIRGAGGQRPELRALAVGLACELRIASPIEVAAHFGFTSTSSVRSAASRFRVRRSREPGFDELASCVSSELHRLVLSAGLGSARREAA